MVNQRINCAIYTRKSTEEGLDQEFNSLDNQFEAAKAFIQSQKHEGWKFIKRYDDGGFSGGNIERPGVQALLKDIEQGLIQCVVVYKVDRLSRSLIDFSKMMELFEKHEISFVSVTQNLNTSNSMGKLTLNVLLSFAQFEREVTAERIRDKIAASKKKGMWMGGNVPFGYFAKDKKLFIKSDEAQKVNYIFQSYLTSSSINDLRSNLKEENILTRSNKPWTNSELGRLLRNCVYIGKIKHKDQYYDAQHKAIIDDSDLWDEVQVKLDELNNKKSSSSYSQKYLLFQKLYTPSGEQYKCDAAIKTSKESKTRYEYYVSSEQRFRTKKIDDIVSGEVKKLLSSKNILQAQALDELHQVDWGNLLNEAKRDLAQLLVSKIFISKDAMKIEIDLKQINNLKDFQKKNFRNQNLQDLDSSYLSSDGEFLIMRIDIKNQTSQIAEPIAKNVLQLVSKASKFKEAVEQGKSISKIAESHSVTKGYISRILRIAYLSPKIIESIINFKYSEELTIETLEKISELICWKEQEKQFLKFQVNYKI